MKLKEKNIDTELENKLNEVGVHPDLARIYAQEKLIVLNRSTTSSTNFYHPSYFIRI
tara:strand:+ start:907 stop:1077 length:171 start_codon:yes stop_codon:yes gene_type:complete